MMIKSATGRVSSPDLGKLTGKIAGNWVRRCATAKRRPGRKDRS